MTRFLSSVFTICAVAGCGLDGTLESSREERSSDSSQLRQIPPPVLSLRFEPSTRERQRISDAVATNFPDAAVTVSASRGTLSTLGNFELQLRCTPGRSVDQVVIEALGALPEIFRIEPSEWAGEGTLSCAQVQDGAWVTLTRQRAGSSPLGDQTAVVRVRKFLGRASLDFVVGHYLPTVDALEQAMAATVAVDEKVLLQTVAASALPYTTFDRCVVTGAGKWQVAGDDELALDAPRWSRREDATGTTMWQQRVATVLIASHHVVPALMQSDAYCPPRVGWRVTLDAVKGDVQGVAAGVGCVVCLAP
jgi:hypothetical protein